MLCFSCSLSLIQALLGNSCPFKINICWTLNIFRFSDLMLVWKLKQVSREAIHLRSQIFYYLYLLEGLTVFTLLLNLLVKTQITWLPPWGWFSRSTWSQKILTSIQLPFLLLKDNNLRTTALYLHKDQDPKNIYVYLINAYLTGLVLFIKTTLVQNRIYSVSF